MKVKEVAKALKRLKLNVGEMHSDLEQNQREAIMHEFRNGRINMLVATDIVARGIDIDDIRLVINYDVPHDNEDYVHRIGRTARANNDGCAITFVSETEQTRFKQIEDFLEKQFTRFLFPKSWEKLLLMHHVLLTAGTTGKAKETAGKETNIKIQTERKEIKNEQ